MHVGQWVDALWSLLVIVRPASLMNRPIGLAANQQLKEPVIPRASQTRASRTRAVVLSGFLEPSSSCAVLAEENVYLWRMEPTTSFCGVDCHALPSLRLTVQGVQGCLCA